MNQHATQGLLRNPQTAAFAESARRAKVAGTAATAAAGEQSPASGTAGTIAGSGDWQPYGRLGVTPLGTGSFRLSGRTSR